MYIYSMTRRKKMKMKTKDGVRIRYLINAFFLVYWDAAETLILNILAENLDAFERYNMLKLTNTMPIEHLSHINSNICRKWERARENFIPVRCKQFLLFISRILNYSNGFSNNNFAHLFAPTILRMSCICHCVSFHVSNWHLDIWHRMIWKIPFIRSR